VNIPTGSNWGSTLFPVSTDPSPHTPTGGVSPKAEMSTDTRPAQLGLGHSLATAMGLGLSYLTLP